MSFAFNFGHDRSSEEDEHDAVGKARGRRGKRDGIADGDDNVDDAALRAAPRPRNNATRNGVHDSVIELSLASDSDIVNGGDETALLINVCFESDVTLRGVSSELACNELAAFGSRRGGGRCAAVAAAASSGTRDCGGAARGVDLDDDDPPAVAAAAQGSDLIPRVYEGGMKVWEGAGDLVNYMVRSSIPREGATVLELGMLTILLSPLGTFGSTLCLVLLCLGVELLHTSVATCMATTASYHTT